MNTKLTIKNFRVFDENGVTVDLKPITVLTGCNSSGKSSVVKAALMLNEFWKQQEKEPNTYDVKIDFSSYPINQMGRFDKVLHNGSESKVVTFEYTVYSPYISKDVTVKLELVAIEKDSLNNAYLQKVKIGTDNDILFHIEHNLSNIGKRGITFERMRNGNFVVQYNLIKEEFLDFLVIGRLIEKLRSLEYSHNDECYPETPISDEEYNEEKSKILQHKTRCEDSKRQLDIANCYSFGYTEMSKRCGIKIAEKAQKTGSLFYIPIIEDLNKMSKKDVCFYIENELIKEREKTECEQKIINDFKESDADTFGQFFKNAENEYINSTNELSPGRESMFKNAPLFAEMYSVLMNWNQLVHPEESAFYSQNDEFVHHGGTIFFEHTIERLFYKFAQEIIKECMSPAFSAISYVSSSRATIKRLYTLETKDDFSVLLKKCLESGNIKPEKSFINKWVKKFGIGDSITFHADSEGLGVQIRLHKTPEDKDGRLLADEGYGITQLLSIMLQIEMSGKSETTIAVE